MKGRLVLLLVLILGSTGVRSQSLTIVQGGWATIVGQDPVKSSGYRFALGWEFPREERQWMFGFSFGTIQVSGTRAFLGATRAFKFSSIPFYGVIRLNFGGERLKVFMRIGVGGHHSTLRYDDDPLAKEAGWGVSTSSGAGVMYWISKKVFIGCDYEWLWLSNTHPNMGTIGITSFSAGLKM